MLVVVSVTWLTSLGNRKLMFFQGHLHKCPAPAFRLAPDIHAILFPCWQEENSWEAQLDWMESSRPATPKVTTQQQRQKKVTAEMTSKSFKTNICSRNVTSPWNINVASASWMQAEPWANHSILLSFHGTIAPSSLITAVDCHGVSKKWQWQLNQWYHDIMNLWVQIYSSAYWQFHTFPALAPAEGSSSLSKRLAPYGWGCLFRGFFMAKKKTCRIWWFLWSQKSQIHLGSTPLIGEAMPAGKIRWKEDHPCPLPPPLGLRSVLSRVPFTIT